MNFDPLPIQFRKSQPLVFNIDYFDYISGAGFKTFYLLGLKDSGGAEYSLTSQATIHADTNNIQFVKNAASDDDFDITFANPATTMAGEAIITLSCSISAGAGNNMRWQVTLYHVDAGATETQIGQVTFPTITESADGQEFFKLSGKTAIIKKRFNAGDKLRATVEATIVNGSAKLYFDPSGRLTNTEFSTGATINSQSTILIPFEVDL